MSAAGGEDEDGVIAGINVTPLVDITLVLLIIFIVTARIIVSQALPLDLPKAATGQEVQQIFMIEMPTSGEIRVDGKAIAKDEAILDLAKAALQKNPELRAIIRAETAVPHGKVMRALDLLKQAGVAKIAFGNAPTGAEPGAVPKPGSTAAPAASP